MRVTKMRDFTGAVHYVKQKSALDFEFNCHQFRDVCNALPLKNLNTDQYKKKVDKEKKIA